MMSLKMQRQYLIYSVSYIPEQHGFTAPFDKNGDKACYNKTSAMLTAMKEKNTLFSMRLAL
jgi:hypothetical protein